ncbi:MAG: PqqD family protein [Elusimicrobiales bacterium]|nr:PqqD family protein [Elusimicrobiales bacterium]MCK5357438.1 PqqD family protein [Elusimicrobiales bacterium]
MDKNSYVSKNKKIPYRIIEGEAVLVDVDRGEVIHLNSVGAGIWDFIGEKTKIGDIANHICEKFDIENDAAAIDVLEFVSSLNEKGFVKIV